MMICFTASALPLPALVQVLGSLERDSNSEKSEFIRIMKVYLKLYCFKYIYVQVLLCLWHLDSQQCFYIQVSSFLGGLFGVCGLLRYER